MMNGALYYQAVVTNPFFLIHREAVRSAARLYASALASLLAFRRRKPSRMSAS